MDRSIEELKFRIIEVESQLSNLRKELEKAESRKEVLSTTHSELAGDWSAGSSLVANASARKPWPMHADEYMRYGRQMIMPEIGLQGVLRYRQ